jgi:hypothetical protein
MIEPTNKDRAARAEKVLIAYAHLEGRMDELAGYRLAETLLSDLLADFMHLADRKKMDFKNCLDVAQMHFDAEIAEAGRGS